MDGKALRERLPLAFVLVGLVSWLGYTIYTNFREAQARSVTSDMHDQFRNASRALEAYRVDHGRYPPPVSSGDGWTRLPQVISDAREHWHSDPERLPYIRDGNSLGYSLIKETSEQWAPLLEGLEPRPAFILLSPGPTRKMGPFRLDWNMVYDATNGTFSEGYLFLFGEKQEVPVAKPVSAFTYDPTNGTSSR